MLAPFARLAQDAFIGAVGAFRLELEAAIRGCNEQSEARAAQLLEGGAKQLLQLQDGSAARLEKELEQLSRAAPQSGGQENKGDNLRAKYDQLKAHWRELASILDQSKKAGSRAVTSAHPLRPPSPHRHRLCRRASPPPPRRSPSSSGLGLCARTSTAGASGSARRRPRRSRMRPPSGTPRSRHRRPSPRSARRLATRWT